MADIRIKDLTTTASSTASDDFIAVDGTTNGTRKLSAFSPSFGGNATVTGTLTVSGTGASSFGGRLAIGATALSDRMFYVSGNTGTTGASQFSAVVNPTIPNTVTTGAYGLYLGTNIATGATVTNGYSLFIAAPDYTGSTVANKYGLYSNDPNPSYFVGNVLVGSTTASTTTSTGALVVSGGVGVAGKIYAGNAINATVNGGASIIGRNGSASSFTSIVAYSGASDEVKGTLTSSTAGVIIVGSQTNHPLAVYVNNAEVARWDTSANFQTRVTGTAPSLATNSTMTFELTSNTSLKIFVRGSDGTTRSTTLTLA